MGSRSRCLACDVRAIDGERNLPTRKGTTTTDTQHWGVALAAVAQDYGTTLDDWQQHTDRRAKLASGKFTVEDLANIATHLGLRTSDFVELLVGKFDVEEAS